MVILSATAPLVSYHGNCYNSSKFHSLKYMLPAILIDNNILKSPALNLIMSTNPFQIYCLKKKNNKTIGLIVFLYSVIMLVWSPSSMPADGNNEVLTLNNKIFCEDFTYWKISFFMPGKEFGDSEQPSNQS